MNHRPWFALLTLACLGASLPAAVKSRPLTTGADPIGTWAAGDAEPLVVAAPRDNGQLYDIRVGDSATGMGKGLSDGDWLYVVYPVLPGERIALGAFERAEKGVQGIIGLYKLGWETWTPKQGGSSYAGAWKMKGVTATGGKLGIDLAVREAGPDVYDLVWQGKASRFEGAGLLANDKLVLARWGITVTDVHMGGNADGSLVVTKTTDHRERPHLRIGAYHLAGDRLEGRTLDADTSEIRPLSMVRRP